jgi:hypothetical protein
MDHEALIGNNKQTKSIQFAFGSVFQQHVINRPATDKTKRTFYDAMQRRIRDNQLPVELLGIKRVHWVTAGAGVVGLSVPVKINGLEQVVLLRTDLAAQNLKKAIAPTASAPV